MSGFLHLICQRMGFLRLPVFCALTALAMPAETTQAVLARMDKEAAAFQQMTANIKKDTYTAVLNDTTTEAGIIWMKRSGRNIEMRTEFTQPEPVVVAFAGNTFQRYMPKIRTVQIYDLGKYRGLVDQFIVLGFGSSGRDLEKNFTVNAAGEEMVDGRRTTKLQLVPKSKDAQEQFKNIDLWVPLDAGHPVRQRLLQPGGDYYLFAYSDVKLNPGLADDAFRLKLPSGVRKEYPQK